MSTTSTLANQLFLINGQEITVRPIRHDDTTLEADFVKQLSTESKHFRFFGGFRQLSDAEIQSLCDVDYHNSMAFVALATEKGKTREVGVVRYIKDAVTDAHEMALTVADDFKLSTLGHTLVECLVAYARKHQVKSLYSIELHDNSDMRKLAKQLGMAVKRDPNDTHQLIYTLSVDEHLDTPA